MEAACFYPLTVLKRLREKKKKGHTFKLKLSYSSPLAINMLRVISLSLIILKKSFLNSHRTHKGVWSEWQRFLKSYWRAKSPPSRSGLERKAWITGGRLKRSRSSGSTPEAEGTWEGNMDTDTKSQGRLKAAHSDKESSPLYRKEIPHRDLGNPWKVGLIYSGSPYPQKEEKCLEIHRLQDNCRLQGSPNADICSLLDLCSLSPLPFW